MLIITTCDVTMQIPQNIYSLYIYIYFFFISPLISSYLGLDHRDHGQTKHVSSAQLLKLLVFVLLKTVMRDL